MTVSEIMEKMIAFSEGNIHDIDHLIRVWTYAKTIGELEGLDSETQFILEVAAITHDIACPLCRKKYGNTNGKHQETEGAVMVRDFLSDARMTEKQIDRVAFNLFCGCHFHFNDMVKTSSSSYGWINGIYHVCHGKDYLLFERTIYG